MDFTTIDIGTLTRSVTAGGVRYLQLFLQDYTALFPGPVNPSCPKCLNEYLSNYKKHYNNMENSCKYRLHAKYENMPLEFGSPILINNSNITNEYAHKLLEQPNGARFFAFIPPKPEPVIQQLAKAKKAIKKTRTAKKKEIPLPHVVPATGAETETDDDISDEAIHNENAFN